MVDTQVFNDMYEKEVDLKYQLYNGLFLTLPLDAVEQTGLLLPLLEQACDQGLQFGQSPEQIIRDFFQTHRAHFTEDKQIQFLFKVIQYVERQVVLIDALEDAAYAKIHQTKQRNRMRQLTQRVSLEGLEEELKTLLPQLGQRGYRGLSLTIPHKVEVIPHLMDIVPEAEVMGAVNTLQLLDG